MYGLKQGTNEIKSDLEVFNVPSDELNIGRKKMLTWVAKIRAPYVTVVGESQDGITERTNLLFINERCI